MVGVILASTIAVTFATTNPADAAPKGPGGESFTRAGPLRDQTVMKSSS